MEMINYSIRKSKYQLNKKGISLLHKEIPLIKLGSQGIEPHPVSQEIYSLPQSHCANFPKELPEGLGPSTPRLQITCSTN